MVPDTTGAPSSVTLKGFTIHREVRISLMVLLSLQGLMLSEDIKFSHENSSHVLWRFLQHIWDTITIKSFTGSIVN